MTEYEKKCLTCKNNYKPSDCEPKCNCMCENHNMYDPISRYDRLVKMSVEEMAQFINDKTYGCMFRFGCPCDCGDNYPKSCVEKIKEWLESPLEEC